MTDSNVHEFTPRVVEAKPPPPPTMEADLDEIIDRAKAGQVKLEALQAELDEARAELERTQADLNTVTMGYEDLEGTIETALEPVLELFDEIHRDEGHAGPWSFCRDPLCRRLEEWTHHRRQDLGVRG